MKVVEKHDGFTCDNCHAVGERGASAYTCTACYHTLHVRHGSSSTISADDRFDWCVPCYTKVHGKRRRVFGNVFQGIPPKRLRAALTPSAESSAEAVRSEIDNDEESDSDILAEDETSDDETSSSSSPSSSQSSTTTSYLTNRLADNGKSDAKPPEAISFDAHVAYLKEPGARKCVVDFYADRDARRNVEKGGIMVLDAFAGASTALLALLRLGIRVDAYIAIESDRNCRKQIAEVCRKHKISFALHDDVTRGGFRDVAHGITDRTVKEERFGIETLSALMEKVGCDRMIDLYTFGSYVRLYRARALSLYEY